MNKRPTILFVAVLFSAHLFISAVLSCSTPPCQQAVLAFVNELRVFPSEYILFSTSHIFPPKLFMTTYFVDPVTCYNCSYTCLMADIYGDLEASFVDYPGNSTVEEPFPPLIYGFCVFGGGIDYSLCTISSTCAGRRAVAENVASGVESAVAVTNTHDEEASWVPTREYYGEYGTCSAGAAQPCPAPGTPENAQCCNHSMGGQGFLCMLYCPMADLPNEPDMIDCLNGVFSNYCNCLGICT